MLGLRGRAGSPCQSWTFRCAKRLYRPPARCREGNPGYMPSLEFTLMVGCPLKCNVPVRRTSCAESTDATRSISASTPSRPCSPRCPSMSGSISPAWPRPWGQPACHGPCCAIRWNRVTNSPSTPTLYGLKRSECAEVIGLLRSHAQQVEVVCLHLALTAKANMRGLGDTTRNMMPLCETSSGLAMERVIPKLRRS